MTTVPAVGQPKVSTAGSRPSDTQATAKSDPQPEKPPSNRVRSQQDCPEGMVFIPGGELPYPWLKDETYNGETLADVVAQGRVDAFCIDRLEVKDLDLFEAKQCPSEPMICAGLAPTMPATCVTRERAECFCDQGTEDHRKRLPSPEEWLFAAVGETGRKFPWGDTWFPWGNDRYDGRPDNGRFGERFCDGRPDPRESGSPTAARWLPRGFQQFDMSDCSAHHKMMDVSPFGVENMGSSVLELTSLELTFTGSRRTAPVLGLDHRQLKDGDASPPTSALINLSGVTTDPSIPIINRARKDVGFRCAMSEHAVNNTTP